MIGGAGKPHGESCSTAPGRSERPFIARSRSREVADAVHADPSSRTLCGGGRNVVTFEVSVSGDFSAVRVTSG